jgi:hypothetical protein
MWRGVSRPHAAVVSASAQRAIGRSPRFLKTGLDKAFLPDTTPDADPIQHGNIRGRGYYH